MMLKRALVAFWLLTLPFGLLPSGSPVAAKSTEPGTRGFEVTSEPRVFANPILLDGADPWVARHGESFFYCSSTGGAIFVGKSASLLEIGQNKKAVFTPPPGQKYSRNLWAPELHFLDGKWFIYFAADDGRNENHRMWALRAKTDDPQGEYELLGQLDTGDRWAIDGSILEHGGKRYFIWSGWEGTQNIAQNIYIAPMQNPWTLGARVKIAEPQFAWETNHRPHVNEGPTTLSKGERLFIIFSASGSWTDDYCLGRLDFLGGEVLDPQNWRKYPEPVFSRTATVAGPGHASFVNDGRRDWIIYHAAKSPGAGWRRNIRMQTFRWNGDGTPEFGAPLPAGAPVE